ncbi:acetyl-CoA acetyltransferase [Actinomadura madurae]|uniref:thiolase C-terminal domain-containing protein n=3 Tax=Actinomadura madurae TaxID=1993 RepID=UPI0020263F5A|nr:acetyl-CoA acetyltransferase [Actinomadura madurae]URM93918.1 acetyl-CoA acetyltransferase [Actinomadura madurae]
MFPKDETAVVGIGSTPYYKRGASLPQTKIEMACKAILAACEDAGLSVEDVDGFAYYSGGSDTALIAQTLGIPEVRFTGTLTGGGGGAAGSVGLAAAAITSGHANVVVSLMTLQQVTGARFGVAFASKGGGTYSRPVGPEMDFVAPHGLFAPGQMFSLLARRHMHRYGTRREAFAEVAISTRENAINRPTARFRDRITLDDYMSARMISDPLCLFDYTQENDGAVAVITTAADRARDLRKPPVYVAGAANGSAGRWGQAITWMGMPDEYFASSGHRTVARDVYARAGVAAADIDVALLYDHFTPMVVMQLEDYGFCEIGEGGPFVESGAIRWKTGSIPVNTHGGNLSEAYIIGMTHVKEAVEQLRGEAVNQVEDAELALVTGGPAPTPVSALILRK